MADDPYQRTTAPRLMPAPLPSYYDLEELLARLLRYQDGPNLVTLSADAVPAALASAFPLTTKQWARALQRRAVDDYWESDHCGHYAEITVILSSCIYRGRGVLAEGHFDGWFEVFVDGAPREDEHQRLIPASSILSVTGIGDPPDPRPQAGYTLIPTLADACGYGKGDVVAAGEPGVVWYSDSRLRLYQGALHPNGPIVWVSGEPFDDEPIHRGLVRALDGAPARGWFWMTVVARMQTEVGASLAILTADPDAAGDGATVVAVRGTLAGIDLEPEVPVLLIEVPEPEGFTVRRVPLDAVGRMEMLPPTSWPGGFRQGLVEVGALPLPEVERREALGRIRDGGDYLLLWQPHSEAFTMLQLRDVHLVGDQIRGTRSDGFELEFPFVEMLAVQDPEATMQRALAEKLAWWDVLPDLLTPLEGCRGTVVFAIDGKPAVHEGVTYLSEGGEGFRFATADGVEEVASDDLIAFEVDCPDCGGNHLWL